VPPLPRSVWLLESGGFIDNFGTGLVFPFVVLYLHDVRHFSVTTAGFFIAVRGASGLGLAPLGGALADRLGARAVAVVSMLTAAAGWVALAEVREAWQLYLVAILIGASNAGFWPAYSALLAELAPPELRHTAYSVSNLLRNAGIGLGAVVGGLAASTAHPNTYTMLLFFNAASFIIYALVALALPRGMTAGTAAPESDSEGGYRHVLRDRGLLVLVAINASFIATFTAANYFVAPFLHDHAGVSERGIGVVWALNTAAIVLFQLTVASFMARRRYMVGLAAAAGIWATSLIIVAAAGTTLDGTTAVAAVSGAFLLYAACDCLLTPTQGAIVAQLAPDHLRGRYMAVSSMSWEMGAFVGPAIAGIIYAAAPTAMWLIFAMCAALTGLAALVGEQLLPEAARRPILGQSG
jgi:MFS family permease